LKCLFAPVIAAANSIAVLIVALASAVLATNVATADEYIAIVLPGRMFKAAFEKRRLAPDRFCPGRSVRPELPGRRSSPGTVAAPRWQSRWGCDAELAARRCL
jgi:hypothetical protein